MHLPQFLRESVPRLRARQRYALVRQYAPGQVVELLSGYCVIKVVLGPCDKERAAVVYMPEPAEIVIAPVKAVYAVRHNREAGFSGGQFVAFGVGDDNESGDIAIMVQHAMQFERALARAEPGPREQRQAKLDNRGVNAVELVFEAEAMLRRKSKTTGQQ